MAKTLNSIVKLLSVVAVVAEEVRQVVAVDQVAVLEAAQQTPLVVRLNPGKEILVDLALLQILAEVEAEAAQDLSVLLQPRAAGEVVVAD
jgi:hypothetical protein